MGGPLGLGGGLEGRGGGGGWLKGRFGFGDTSGLRGLLDSPGGSFGLCWAPIWFTLSGGGGLALLGGGGGTPPSLGLVLVFTPF